MRRVVPLTHAAELRQCAKAERLRAACATRERFIVSVMDAHSGQALSTAHFQLQPEQRGNRIVLCLREHKAASNQPPSPACVAAIAEVMRQGLLDAVWAPGFDWHLAVAEHRRLVTDGGHEAFLLLALVPPRRLPAKGLLSRLARLNDPSLTAAFVRAAAGMRVAPEHALFEQTLEMTLQHQLQRWRDANANPAAHVVVRACELLIAIAERVAFAYTLVDARQALPPAVARSTFALPVMRDPLRRPVRSSEGRENVRPARLHAWAARCAEACAQWAFASQALLNGFLHQCNEVLDAVIAGRWSRDDLRHAPWLDLARPVWRRASTAPSLPEAGWPAPRT